MSKLVHMFDHLHQPHYLFTASAEDQGFIVAEVDVERGRKLSITGSIYTSEDAYKLGNSGAIHSCGCIHEDIEKYIPALAPFIPLHLSDIETGEPDSLRNALHFLNPEGALKSEREFRTKNGRKNYWSSPDDDSLLHDYFIGLCADIIRVKDVDTLKTLLVERANEKWPAQMDEESEPWTFEDVIDSFMLDDIWEALVMYLAPAWREQAVEFSLWLEQQPAPQLTPSDSPSEEFEHKFDNGLYVKAIVEDHTVESPIMKGEYVHRYTVVVKFDGKRRTFHPTGSVADRWLGHKDARQAAWGILREVKDIYEMGEEFWEMIEVDPNSAQAKKGDANAELFGEAIMENWHIVG